MSKTTSKLSKYKYFIPTFLIFILSVIGVLSTFIFQNIEDELDYEILVVEHQKLLLSAVQQYHPDAVKGDKSALENLELNSRLFETSIEALREGGSADGMQEKFVIPGTSILEAKQQIKAITGVWRDYKVFHRQAKLNYKNGVIKGTESDLYDIRNMFYNLERYNTRLLGVFIQNKEAIYRQKLIAIGIMLLLMVLVLIYTYKRYMRKVNTPLEKLVEITEALEHGDLSNKLEFTENTPIGLASRSINRIVDYQNDLTEKFELLGEGEFSFEITKHGKNDKLNTSLENMRKKLSEFYELDRKKAQQASWVNKGETLFSEILRKNTDDIDKLTDVLIKDMVKYLGANQGCIYLLETNKRKQQKLVLKSTYAWERKKYQEKEIEIGEGLIGQAFIEQETIYLTDVPDSYVNITSGLGEANPRSILIVPMKYNEEIYGVLEIASFKEYENFELALVDKIVEGIASAISTVRNNQHTRNLLQDSQMLTEQMKSQEEELRQNAEELQATQENINQQLELMDFEKQKNTAVLEACIDGIVTFDEHGFIELFNETAEAIFSTGKENALGQRIGKLMPLEIVKEDNKQTVKFRKDDELIDISSRTEVTIQDVEGKDVNILITLSENNISGKYFFAVFLQKNAIELF